MSTVFEKIAHAYIGVGNYVTHEDRFGGYDTHMVVARFDDGSVEIVKHRSGEREFAIVPRVLIIGIGETPGDAAHMKDQRLAERRRENEPSSEHCPLHGVECTAWAAL